MLAFHPGDLGESEYAILEMAYSVGRGEAAYSAVQLAFVNQIFAPINNVLEYSLIELVKYIRSNASVNIHKREPNPERFIISTSDIAFHAHSMYTFMPPMNRGN